MTPVQKICIPCVDNAIDVQIIYKTFANLQIAKIKKIHVIPYNNNNKLSIVIHIDHWYDTEVAYNFIQRLKDPSKEARIMYKNHDELWWPVYTSL